MQERTLFDQQPASEGEEESSNPETQESSQNRDQQESQSTPSTPQYIAEKTPTDTRKQSLQEEKESGSVGHRQEQVLGIIRAAGAAGLTDREIHAELAQIEQGVQSAHVAPRRNELWQQQRIFRGLKRKCTITGKMVYTWRLPVV